MAEIIRGYFPTPAERVVRDVEAIIADLEARCAPEFPAVLKSNSTAWPDYWHPYLVLTRRGEVRLDVLQKRRDRAPDDLLSERLSPYVRRDSIVAMLQKIMPRLVESVDKGRSVFFNMGDGLLFTPEHDGRGDLKLATDRDCAKAVGGTWYENPIVPSREVTFAKMPPEPA